MSALLERTVGELVAEIPARARVFEQHRIDYCCGGKITLAEACTRRKVDQDTVLRELEAVRPQTGADTATDWNTAPLGELIDHIVHRHHDYLRAELPRIDALAMRVAQVHGSHAPETIEILRIFAGLRLELQDHTMKEERILFPWIRHVEQGKGADGLPGSMANPVRCMEAEHDEAGRALEALRRLSDDFQPPADACNTWRVLYASLEVLEQDMHEHIHKENSILFPRALALEAAGAGREKVAAG
jgi:regulator of cell morphogenesis and NO signaling